MDSLAIGTTAPASATANSALFNTLPPELRRLILIDAFGGRRMHVYQSFAFVCHTHRPESDDYINPTTDDCLGRGPLLLRGGEHALGAAGWLLSCRQSLPSLRKLYIGFSTDAWFWGEWSRDPKERFLAHTEHILPLLDRLACALGEVEEIEVGFPTSVFYAHFCRGIEGGESFQLPNWRPVGSFPGSYYPRKLIWRPIPPPEATAKGDTGKGVNGGYWIGETESDMFGLRAWLVTMPRYWE